MSPPEILLAARGLQVVYRRHSQPWWRSDAGVVALREIDLDIYSGETLALVGESGCGKTTLARALVRCSDPSGGQITFRGADVTHTQGRALRSLRRHLQ